MEDSWCGPPGDPKCAAWYQVENCLSNQECKQKCCGSKYNLADNCCTDEWLEGQWCQENNEATTTSSSTSGSSTSSTTSISSTSTTASSTSSSKTSTLSDSYNGRKRRSVRKYLRQVQTKLPSDEVKKIYEELDKCKKCTNVTDTDLAKAAEEADLILDKNSGKITCEHYLKSKILHDMRIIAKEAADETSDQTGNETRKRRHASKRTSSTRSTFDFLKPYYAEDSNDVYKYAVIIENSGETFIGKRMDPVYVDTMFQLVTIGEVNLNGEYIDATVSLSLQWKDERLEWEPQNYSDVRQLRMSHNKVWTPSFDIMNRIHDFSYQDEKYNPVIIKYNGMVTQNR